MLKKFMLALAILPFASVVMAGDVNPGEDNPGTTYITDDFVIGASWSGSDSCFDESNFCTEYYVSPAPEELRGKKRAEAALEIADEFAAVACYAAAAANASAGWIFEGGGELVIARHGNHGAVHRIRLDAGLATATLTAVDASAIAGAGALAYAYAFASADSLTGACEEVLVADFPGDLDPELIEFCAIASAMSEAEAEALAVAGALSGSEGSASSGAYGAASIYNEVWAANIEQYITAVAAGAGSFAQADAEAAAVAFAAAFARAFAEAHAQACAGEGAQDLAICGNEGSEQASAYAAAYALAYAEAQASATAEAVVEVGMPVLYRNENGIEDTVVFGPDATTAYGEASVEVNCEVPDDPDA